MENDELDQVEDDEDVDDDLVDFSDVTGDDEPGESPEVEDSSPEGKLRQAELDAAAARATAKAFEEQLKREREERDRIAAAQTRVEEQSRELPPPPPKKKLSELLPDDFDQQFIQNPKAATKAMLDMMDAEVDRRLSSSGTSAQLGTAEALITNFMRDQRDLVPEEYTLAGKYFREKVDSYAPQVKLAFLNSPPATQRNALQSEWDIAYARAQRENINKSKQLQTQRRAAPPPPSRGRLSGGVPTGNGSRGTPMTVRERAVYDQCIAMGLKKADAMEAVIEFRQEQKGA